MARELTVNPWLEIWFQPRSTIRAIITYSPAYRLWLMAFLYGLPVMFNLAQGLSMAERMPIIGTFVIVLALATLIGIIGISISSGLIYWTGQWIGGRGSFKNVRAAVAWSNVPNMVNIGAWAMMLIVFRYQVFYQGFPQMTFSGFESAAMFFAFLAQSIAAVWSFIILLKALGEVQGFSAWKALLNVMIPFVLVVLLLWLGGWVWGLLHWGMSGAVQ